MLAIIGAIVVIALLILGANGFLDILKPKPKRGKKP
jgi:hypothetical protein